MCFCLKAIEVKVNEVEFNPTFVSRMIPKLEWSALVQAAEEVGSSKTAFSLKIQRDKRHTWHHINICVGNAILFNVIYSITHVNPVNETLYLLVLVGRSTFGVQSLLLFWFSGLCYTEFLFVCCCLFSSARSSSRPPFWAGGGLWE